MPAESLLSPRSHRPGPARPSRTPRTRSAARRRRSSWPSPPGTTTARKAFSTARKARTALCIAQPSFEARRSAARTTVALCAVTLCTAQRPFWRSVLRRQRALGAALGAGTRRPERAAASRTSRAPCWQSPISTLSNAAARYAADRRSPRVAVHGGAFTQLQAGERAQHPNGLHSNGCGFLAIALCARPRCGHCGGGARSRAPRARQTAGSLKRSHVNMRMPFICTTFTWCNSPPGLHTWPGTRRAPERSGHLQATQH